MNCPYLEKGRVDACAASITLLTPSIEEAEEYCSSEEHYRCPMLLSHVLRSGTASEYRN